MHRDFWHKQTGEPLYSELLWSRPENRAHAGKLLIVGGSAHGFAAEAESFAESVRAGVGTARVLLPDAIQKIVGVIIDTADFVPSTPSGSLAQKALAELLTQAHWADGVLLPGDLGRNSETAILLEKYLAKIPVATTLTRDAADYLTPAPRAALARANTLLVLSLSQLQKLATNASTPQAITFGMDMLRLVDWLHEFTQQHQAFIITEHLGTIFVAVQGRISTTARPAHMPQWRLKTATHASVWWLQNPAKPFEALTTAVHEVTSGVARN